MPMATPRKRACYERVMELLPSSNYNADFKGRLEKTAREKLRVLR